MPSDNHHRPPTAATARDDELMESTLELLHVPDDKKDGVRADVTRVAMMFEENRWGSSRRIADIEKALLAIAKRAKVLDGVIKKVWPDARRLAFGYVSLEDWREAIEPRSRRGSPEDRREAIETVHIGGISEFVNKPAKWATTLQEIADLTGWIRQRLPEDTGGEHNISEMFNGTAKMVLAVQCWELYWGFRPDDRATGYDKGDFHALNATVYELATGVEPEADGAGLINHTKKAAVFCNGLRDRNPQFDRLRRALAPGESPIGLISRSGAAAPLFDTPNRFLRELTSRRPPDD